MENELRRRAKERRDVVEEEIRKGGRRGVLDGFMLLEVRGWGGASSEATMLNGMCASLLLLTSALSAGLWRSAAGRGEEMRHIV